MPAFHLPNLKHIMFRACWPPFAVLAVPPPRLTIPLPGPNTHLPEVRAVKTSATAQLSGTTVLILGAVLSGTSWESDAVLDGIGEPGYRAAQRRFYSPQLRILRISISVHASVPLC